MSSSGLKWKIENSSKYFKLAGNERSKNKNYTEFHRSDCKVVK